MFKAPFSTQVFSVYFGILHPKNYRDASWSGWWPTKKTQKNMPTPSTTAHTHTHSNNPYIVTYIHILTHPHIHTYSCTCTLVSQWGNTMKSPWVCIATSITPFTNYRLGWCSRHHSVHRFSLIFTACEKKALFAKRLRVVTKFPSTSLQLWQCTHPDMTLGIARTQNSNN